MLAFNLISCNCHADGNVTGRAPVALEAARDTVKQQLQASLEACIRQVIDSAAGATPPEHLHCDLLLHLGTGGRTFGCHRCVDFGDRGHA